MAIPFDAMTSPAARPASAETARTPVSIFDILRRHVAAVAVSFLVTGVGCLVYRALLQPSVVATAAVVVENPRLDASGLGAADPARYFASQLALARLPIVTRNAIAGLPDASALRVEDVRVTSDQASDTILITATLPHGQDRTVVKLADGVLRSYVALATSARKAQAAQSLAAVDTAVASLRFATSPAATDQRNQLINRQIALRSEAVGPVSLLIPSAAQLQPSGRPGVTRVGLVFLLGGLWAGVAVAVGCDGSARRLTHMEDAARIAGLPVLATLTVHRHRPSAADAVWESVLSGAGLINLLPLTDAFRLSYFDSPGRQACRLRELLGRYGASVRLVDASMRGEDLAALNRDDVRLVIVVGPRSRQSALKVALAELSRINVQAVGLIWSQPAAIAPPMRRGTAVDLRRPSLRRPDGRRQVLSPGVGPR